MGLLFDIVGVILLFRYGLPPSVDRTGAKFLSLGRNEEEIRQGKRYDRMACLAVGLLIFGFALQILSNWL